MTRVEKSILIDVLSEAVRDFISNFERLPEWAPGFNRIEFVSDGEVGAGDGLQRVRKSRFEGLKNRVANCRVKRV